MYRDRVLSGYGALFPRGDRACCGGLFEERQSAPALCVRRKEQGCCEAAVLSHRGRLRQALACAGNYFVYPFVVGGVDLLAYPFGIGNDYCLTHYYSNSRG